MEQRVEQRAKRQVQSLDDFLNYSTKSAGGGGGYLSGWKKKDGQIVVWTHRDVFSAAVWHHPIPRVVELKDEGQRMTTVVMSQRWNCHESDEILKAQYFRDDDTGEREYPPELCPMCIVIEEVRRLYRSGKIDWCDPVFEWEGDRERTKLLAGGIDGEFNSRDLSDDALDEMRKAGVRQRDSYKQDLRTKLQYLFLVVSDRDPDRGIQKAFEAKSLGDAMKKALANEIERRGERGNPQKFPYPFKWKYDEKASFSDKYDALALDQQPPEKILKLISGPAPNIERDIDPSNCWTLYSELESHMSPGVKRYLSLDKCFEKADKAGLMKPAAESKEDESDDFIEAPKAGEPLPKVERTPEVRGTNTKQHKPVEMVLDSNCDVWVEKVVDEKWGGAFKGNIALIDVPDGVTDERIAEVTAMLKRTGAVAVGELVMCRYCRETISTLDTTCKHCGSKYDDDGNLLTRPCLNAECGGQCDVTGKGPRYICEKCATIHELGKTDAGEDIWNRVEAQKAPEPARRARLPFDRPSKK